MSKEFSAWRKAAEARSEVKLMDGRQAVLVGARRTTQSVKIQLDYRHYNCWVDDIALVKIDGTWTLLPPWQAQSIRRDVEVRSLKAPESKSWLNVERNPSLLHPAFQSPSD